MRRHRMSMVGLALAALAAFYVAQGSRAGEDNKVAGLIDKIAAAHKKGDKAAAEKEGKAVSKEIGELYEAMDLMKPRTKGGYGVGPKKGAIMPDGIEQMLLKIGRDAPTPGFMNKSSDALEEMGHRIAAIAEISIAKAPTKDQGKKLVKDWMEWSKDMRDSALELAAASKAKSGANVKTAASKLNNACNSCHTVFR
jgi:hypothetical protein